MILNCIVGFLAVCTFSAAILVVMAVHAPLGYEDDATGFHYGEPPTE